MTRAAGEPMIPSDQAPMFARTGRRRGAYARPEMGILSVRGSDRADDWPENKLRGGRGRETHVAGAGRRSFVPFVRKATFRRRVRRVKGPTREFVPQEWRLDRSRGSRARRYIPLRIRIRGFAFWPAQAPLSDRPLEYMEAVNRARTNWTGRRTAFLK